MSYALPAILADLRNRNAPCQFERFHVERYKAVGPGKWAWVTVGYFVAAGREEARKKGRNALVNRICVLRATPIGLAPEGVRV